MHQYPNTNQSRKLIDHIEGYERVQYQIDQLKLEQKDIKNAARSQGWDMRGFAELIKLRKLSESERDDWLAIRELMMREVGMLADTPLGGAAIRRFEQANQPPELPDGSPQEPQDGQEGEESPDSTSTAPKPNGRLPARQKPAGPTPEEVEAQRQAELADAAKKGAEAGAAWKESKSPDVGILANPYVAQDPRRIVWDREWRLAADSDGMELPAYMKRAAKPKKPKKGEGKGDE